MIAHLQKASLRMCLSSPLPLVCWAVLYMTVMPGVLGRHVSTATSRVNEELVIVSSLLTDSPILEESLGPLDAGAMLQLTCVMTSYQPGQLSWYEGDTLLLTKRQSSTYASNSILVLPALTEADSGRRLTCRLEGTSVARTVKLEVKEKVVIELDILSGEELLRADNVAHVTTGEEHSLICVHRGYQPGQISWYEGDTLLQTKRQSSTYASNSILVLPALTEADSGRRLTCRLEGTSVARTVELKFKDRVEELREDDRSSPFQKQSVRYLLLLIALILLAVTLVVLSVAVFVLRIAFRRPEQSVDIQSNDDKSALLNYKIISLS